ncbi:glycosyltransferase, partial [Campylobacter jejuni]
VAQPSGDAIAFLGPQPHGRVFAELERSDVFLLPSVTAANGDMEGIPVSLMEAMANGVLVLATRHSGIPE